MTLERALLRAFLIYDPETGEFSRRDGTPLHTDVTLQGYVLLRFGAGAFRAHRLAFLYMIGTMPDQIDHINRDTSDNRWSNLRPATTSQNVANTEARRTNKLGLKGVYQERNRYRAEIIRHGVRYRLGSFRTAEEASAAYTAAAERLYGEYAFKGDGRDSSIAIPS